MEMSGQLHALAALPPEERAPGTHWIGGIASIIKEMLGKSTSVTDFIHCMSKVILRSGDNDVNHTSEEFLRLVNARQFVAMVTRNCVISELSPTGTKHYIYIMKDYVKVLTATAEQLQLRTETIRIGWLELY
jgi:hypothetical protein